MSKSDDKPEKPKPNKNALVKKDELKEPVKVATKLYYALAKDSKGVLNVLEMKAAATESELNVIAKNSIVNESGETITLIDVTTADDYNKHKNYLWSDVIFRSNGKRKYSALVVNKEGRKGILDFVLDAKKSTAKGKTISVKDVEYTILELVDFRRKPDRYHDWKAEANLSASQADDEKEKKEEEKDDD